MKRYRLFEPKIRAIFAACNFQTGFKLDFDDALVLASMDALGMQIIVSFDKHFRRLPQIKVLTPEQAWTMLEEK